jgi:cytosol aminopeptidase family protein
VGMVRVHRGDVRGLDELSVEALCLPMYQIVKQPTAVAGCADWRLCGRIAKLLLKGIFKGEDGETLLMPAMGRLGADCIFLFGLGEPRELRDSDVAKRAEDMVSVLENAKMTRVAVAAPELPGRLPMPGGIRDERGSSKDRPLHNLTPALRLLASLIVLAGSKATFQEVVLLDADGSIARADSFLHEAAKRGGFVWRM